MDKRIGAQLFTLRDYCQTAEELNTTLERVSKIGYKTVQLSAIGPISAEEVKAACDKYSLEPICTHKSFDDYTNNLKGMIEYHKAIGCGIAGLGAMPHEFCENEDGIRKFAEIIQNVTNELRAEGIDFAYHNHAFEFAKTADGKYYMDILIEETDIDFILDVYWLAFAGLNPAEYIRKLGKRAVVVHFKDMCMLPGEFKQTMAEVMEGNLNWDEIFEACEAAGVKYAMVEQDVCQRDPFESMKISYDNLAKKGFC